MSNPTVPQADALKRFPSHHLVGRFHVGQAPAEQDVGQHGEEPVGRARLERDPAGRHQEARAIDDVGASLDDRREELRVLVRIELEVGVLDEQHVAGRERQPEADGGPLSHVDRAVVDMHGQVRRQHALVDRAARAVGGAVVRDHDFHLDPAEVHGGHALEHFVDRLLFVVNGNDDGQTHGPRCRHYTTADRPRTDRRGDRGRGVVGDRAALRRRHHRRPRPFTPPRATHSARSSPRSRCSWLPVPLLGAPAFGAALASRRRRPWTAIRAGGSAGRVVRARGRDRVEHACVRRLGFVVLPAPGGRLRARARNVARAAAHAAARRAPGLVRADRFRSGARAPRSPPSRSAHPGSRSR